MTARSDEHAVSNGPRDMFSGARSRIDGDAVGHIAVQSGIVFPLGRSAVTGRVCVLLDETAGVRLVDVAVRTIESEVHLAAVRLVGAAHRKVRLEIKRTVIRVLDRDIPGIVKSDALHRGREVRYFDKAWAARVDELVAVAARRVVVEAHDEFVVLVNGDAGGVAE